MTVWHLITREMMHRWLSFLLAMATVVLAVICVVGSTLFLRQFNSMSETLIATKQAAVTEQIAQMEDDFRKITKRMGFNVLILPMAQNLTDFYAESYADQTMPESYADTLAQAPDIVTIRHLLPMLQAKIEWPEQRRKILLIGVKGEMPWAHRSNLKPLLEPVESGQIVMGYELYRSLTPSVKAGDSIELMGTTFEISALHPERGTIDDITLWINLKDAQTLLDKPGLISAMMALECQCAWANLPKVRQEIQGILPDTQVIELSGKALARAEARNSAAHNALVLLDREKANQIALRNQRERMTALIVPWVITACTLAIGVLAWVNVRQRRVEIGILRAMGLHTRSILMVFLGKAAIVGLLGGLLGMGLGIALFLLLGPGDSHMRHVVSSLSGFVTVLCLTPVITLGTSWIPTLWAIQQDPAIVLCEE